MAARKRPAPEDAVTARRALPGGLARGTGLSGLEPLHPRKDTFPGEVFLHLAAGALHWRGASRAGPLPPEATGGRFLPECSFRGRQNKKLQFAVLAAAALQGGTEPDLLDEAAWWQTGDFWEYALPAAVACIRAATDRAGVPIARACKELAHHRTQPHNTPVCMTTPLAGSRSRAPRTSPAFACRPAEPTTACDVRARRL